MEGGKEREHCLLLSFRAFRSRLKTGILLSSVGASSWNKPQRVATTICRNTPFPMKRSEQPDGNSSSRSDQTRSSVSGELIAEISGIKIMILVEKQVTKIATWHVSVVDHLCSPLQPALLSLLNCFFVAPAPGPSPSPSPSLKKSRQGEEGGNSVSGGSVTSNEALQKMAVDTDPSLLAQSMRSSVDSIDSSNSSTGNKSVVTGLVAAKSTPVPTKSPYDVAMSASKGGHGARIRLPDKLMEYLNNCVEPDVLWWQNEEGFAFDSTRVQKEFLDRHFEKTKLKSFIRSLNRWYVGLGLVVLLARASE